MQPRKLVSIALDFDNTFTCDPEFWEAFVENALARGHKVTIVTSRNEQWENGLELEWSNDEVYEAAERMGIDVVFAGQHCAKVDAVSDIDIWIDDTPHHVVMSPSTLPGWKPYFKKEDLYGEKK